PPPPSSTRCPYTTLFRSKNRPALAQTFLVRGQGSRITVAVNHLKSKGSSCEDVGDPEDPDGQGNCNGVRTAAAAALADWMADGRSEEHTSELQSRFDLVC